MQIENEIKNEVKIEKDKKQDKFLNNIIGKTINSAIDIGLRMILPDLIENQVIEIKDALIQNGLKEGINTAINKTIDFGKSALGIVTGNFENMSQIQTAIGDGGIIDTLSKVLDNTVNKAYKSGYINGNINRLIKNGKNIILDNISNNIKNELQDQIKATEKLENCINKWKESYKNKDIDGMKKQYKEIEKQIKNIIPLENILKETRRVENMHKLVEKNGYDFNIPKLEETLIEKFQ